MAIVNWTNVTDFSQIPAIANTASNGTFWVGMLYMLWIIMFLILIFWGLEIALMVASFLALIMGLLLVYAELVSWLYVLPFIGIILVMFLYIVWSSPKTKT